MIRFVCPSCKSVSAQPDSAAGTAFTCGCGQRLLVPAPAESSPSLPAAFPSSVTANPRPPTAPVPPPSAPPPAPARSRRRDNDYDDDDDYRSPRRRDRASRYDDDFDEEGRYSDVRHGGGRYSPEASAKAATSGLTCSLISLGLLLASFVLWALVAQSNQGRPGGGQSGLAVMVIIVLVVANLVLSLLGIIFSSRGLDASNRYNRGQATAGLVCGILSLVVGCIAGMFFFCIGMVVLSMAGHW